jgi:acylphosphatase
MFIAQACEQALRKSGRDDPLNLAIGATLVSFRGYQMSYKGRDAFFHSLDDLLLRAGQTGTKVVTPHALPSDRISLAQNILRNDKRQEPSLESEVIEPNVEKRFVIVGSVQGVGFRYFATTIANQFHVNGKATNMPDGSIQVIAEGSESNVDAFKKELESGGAKAKVEKIEETVLVRDYFPRGLMNKVKSPDLFAVLLFLLGPDPLEMLCRRLIGLPDIV